MSIKSVMPSNHLILCYPFFFLLSFPAPGSFSVSWLFASGGQSTGASASASVLPGNIQDWFPLGLTGCISLQSKGLSRVFSNTTGQNYQFFYTWLLNSSTLTSMHVLCFDNQLCLTLCVAHQSPLSMEILQVRILEWVAVLPLGDLPSSGIEPRSPTLQADSSPNEPPRKPHVPSGKTIAFSHIHTWLLEKAWLWLYGPL